jgi:hypothetical protein
MRWIQAKLTHKVHLTLGFFKIRVFDKVLKQFLGKSNVIRFGKSALFVQDGDDAERLLVFDERQNGLIVRKLNVRPVNLFAHISKTKKKNTPKTKPKNNTSHSACSSLKMCWLNCCCNFSFAQLMPLIQKTIRSQNKAKQTYKTVQTSSFRKTRIHKYPALR